MTNGQQESPLNWIDIYSPHKPTSEIDLGLGIRPLEKYDGVLRSNQIIVASGSPRNGRIRLALHGKGGTYEDARQCTISHALDLSNKKSIPSDLYEVTDLLRTYREKKNSWTIDGDGGLSLNKARLTLSTILIQQFGSEGEEIPVALVARDNNVASISGVFLDKPGLVVPQSEIWSGSGVSDLPIGWAYSDQPDQPIEPLKQAVLLYGRSGKEKVFVSANSTAVLKAMTGKVSADLILKLASLTEPLPREFDFRQMLSFLVMKPREGMNGINGLIWKLFGYYSRLLMEQGGKDIYGNIPGFIDWSRSPFVDSLLVWIPNTEIPIFQSWYAMTQSVDTACGGWQNFTQANTNYPDIGNELVGVSTHSLKDLLAY